MLNRFYTLLIVPEKTSRVRRWVIPAWVVRGAVAASLFFGALGFLMLIDYAYVMGQIQENKDLKIENRRLRQQVQIHRNKIASVEQTLERIQTFATRLRVITNLEDRENITTSLNLSPPPDANTNIGSHARREQPNATPAQPIDSLASDAPKSARDPELIRLREDQQALEESFQRLSRDTLLAEQNLQDLYELLADQKQFFGALPTRKPASGYFTSGFGVRKAPYGGSEKMHEGLDVANHVGTPIVATANGTVSFASQKPGYGNTVIIDHGYGVETWYGHARQVLVKPGQKVRRGQRIALMGNSGRSTGPHVHYEVRINSIPVDPLSYILEE
jgi:murein DD-endopeptidase MepM/ murein hydrolase activator NlpD